jgi:toxin-antitoxin system PIN domain toxin
MTTWLLDGNVLVALSVPAAAQHPIARAWFEATVARFATCPITQGTLLRLHPRTAPDPRLEAAWRTLESMLAHPAHVFWPDDLSYGEVSSKRLQGGAQVTDAYLAALARHHGGKVATFDKAFSLLHPDVVVKIGSI